MVFNDRLMRERLPGETYSKLQGTIRGGKPLDPSVADVVANCMKDWAIEKGATHFSHWFQPMTGVTAEKHDSFISAQPDGSVIMEFSGKELSQGEPDASSFPSGGLRATFEARGYTAWDPTSYAFIKEGTLCIPSAFYSYSGEALDKKTPLLRSMERLSRQASRILRLLGEDGRDGAGMVTANVGVEQEYFLVDKALFERRRDLVFCGRTLFGAKPPKGQELDDHFFGAIRPRVLAFMKELNAELWKLGILSKTEHNEVAPAQHELALIYTNANTASDHNQLAMELMKKVAERHGLACLLHEKPFAGVNGSGKHNNWSIATGGGDNLLEPGARPSENYRFLLFLVAVVAAVDDYQDLLRLSVASAGNDHRLGASDAPPAIVSVYLGEELTSILESLSAGRRAGAREGAGAGAGENVADRSSAARSTAAAQTAGSALPTVGAPPNVGALPNVGVLPAIPRDDADRNRTSPFAFTGNKFEFRMMGSALSISGPNIVINTIVAESLGRLADRLEGCADAKEALPGVISETFEAHRRILFNGNNYSGEWVREAAARGLPNLENAPDSLPCFVSAKNIALFTENGIFTEHEMRSRYEILMGGYAKAINIEALTMLEIARVQILPAASACCDRLALSAKRQKEIAPELACQMERALVSKISKLADSLYNKAEVLDQALLEAKELAGDARAYAKSCRESVFVAMQELRAVADELETRVGREFWPFPCYGDLLFSV
ncbi:MAG: glutamine synthetase III [Clostridiales bacterium]|nr:glutamine synthetase III [Clostridiales bacterium]